MKLKIGTQNFDSDCERLMKNFFSFLLSYSIFYFAYLYIEIYYIIIIYYLSSYLDYLLSWIYYLLSWLYIEIYCASRVLYSRKYITKRCALDERYERDDPIEFWTQEGPVCVWRLDFKPVFACILLSNIEFSPAEGRTFFFFRNFQPKNVSRVTADARIQTTLINETWNSLLQPLYRLYVRLFAMII